MTFVQKSNHTLLLQKMMILPSFSVPRSLATAAVAQLATVDYTIANRVTEDISTVVAWAYVHDLPFVARATVHLLQTFDDVGSLLIALVVWIVGHTP